MLAHCFHRKNHYVPRLYLKRWATPHRRIWTYRTLVSHSRVSDWQEHSTESVAFHEHLYTQIVAGAETDELEKWLNNEFEAPAEEALDRATSGERLRPDDWIRLIRFFAAQDVRTPARLAEALRRWHDEVPAFLDRTMKRTIARLEAARRAGTVPELRPAPQINRATFPLRIRTQIEPGQQMGQVKAEIVVGRALWLSLMPHLLTRTANVLLQHRWTIVSPPDGLTWFTSDDPAIRLNYYDDGSYDFEGGWNNKGTDLLLPLGPRHLLYTQVGSRPPSRGETLTPAQAKLIRRAIAKHGSRMIFAVEPDTEIPVLRPRIVDAKSFRAEIDQWRNWHAEQTAAERRL